MIDAVMFGVAANRWDTHPGDAASAAGMVTVCGQLADDLGRHVPELRDQIAQARRDGREWLQIWSDLTGLEPGRW